MPRRESGPLEVTLPHEFIARGRSPHGLQRGSTVDAYLALFPLFHVELGIQWGGGAEKVARTHCPQ